MPFDSPFANQDGLQIPGYWARGDPETRDRVEGETFRWALVLTQGQAPQGHISEGSPEN
jgi:hypothetical protein